MRLFGRRRKQAALTTSAAAARAAVADRARAQAERAAAWQRTGDVSPARIRSAYESRRDALGADLRPSARPIAGWSLRAGSATVAGSFMGGRPAMYADEEWPVAGDPMKFWAQLNLADLAPYARAYDIVMPADGLVQLFAAESGGELARYLPASDLPRLELRTEIPIPPDWEEDDESRRIIHTSLLVDLYPEALVPWAATSAMRRGDDGERLECAPSGDLPGYSFRLVAVLRLRPARIGTRWPDAPEPALWTFLAVCDSHADLGLRFSDMGYLWAVIPTAELAAADFTHLLCDGESS
jgi:hypothetical protein